MKKLVTVLVASGAALAGASCGGGGSSERVSFTGNVAGVTVAAVPAPETASVFARVLSLGEILVGRAVAQGACPSSAEDVLACAVSIDSDDLFFNCARVDPDSCTFATRIRIPGQGVGTLAFAADENGNGRPDEGEPGAFPEDGAVPFPICNGDEIVVTDADVDFTDVQPDEEFGTWTAANVEKLADGCPATPTPTAPAATATPTGTPEPTATPTPTPTDTPAL